MGDAIARTLVRLFVTRRHLLEWVPAAQATIGPRLDLLGLLSPDGRRGRHRRLRRCSSLASGGTGRGRWRCRSRRCGSPRRRSPAGRAGRRSWRAGSRCPHADARTLRLTARRTWRFFETFVTAADHMLPPDNFQEDPAPVLAHRTSPTNLGLYLLSTVSARDFGWTGTIEAVERLEATLSSDERARALPRPFLQLVRHARSASARSPIHIFRRQRQSGRPPHRARQCVPGMDGSVRSPTSGVSPASRTRSSSRAKRRAACATGAERRR